MKKQWNKDIQDRLKNFQTKAPDGLLDNIKSEISRCGFSSEPTQAKSQRIMPFIFHRIASVAAAIVILFGLSHLFQREETPLLLPEVESNIPLTTDEAPAQPMEEVSGNHSVVISHTNRLIDKTSIITDTLTDYFQEERTIEEDADTITRQAPAPQKKTEPTPKKKQWRFTTPPRKQRSSLDVGIYYSELIAQINPGKEGFIMEVRPTFPPSDNTFFPNNGGNTENPDDGTNSVDSTSTDNRSLSRAANRSFNRKKSAEKARHHIPVRLGISLRYYLNERWNIQSGLTYSYLASDLSYEGSTPYETKQKLHYVGIPLQIGYHIWKSKNFKGYVSAGGQVEKLISGKATTHYTLDDRSSGTLIENISDNRLLFSALASIGAEYALGKNFSLYAEPGIHYYFKNGNGLKTHYNDQPLNFNITIGFRFHWNK